MMKKFTLHNADKSKLGLFMQENAIGRKELARELGVSENYIYQMLAGSKQLNRAFLFRFANRFGLNAARLIAAESDMLAQKETSL
jgi:plasmid maintenance system antidote protein VapI